MDEIAWARKDVEKIRESGFTSRCLIYSRRALHARADVARVGRDPRNDSIHNNDPRSAAPARHRRSSFRRRTADNSRQLFFTWERRFSRPCNRVAHTGLYHLLGRIKSIPDCALSLGEIADYCFGLVMQQEEQLYRLQDALRNKTFLFVGLNFYTQPFWMIPLALARLSGGVSFRLSDQLFRIQGTMGSDGGLLLGSHSLRKIPGI